MLAVRLAESVRIRLEGAGEELEAFAREARELNALLRRRWWRRAVLKRVELCASVAQRAERFAAVEAEARHFAQLHEPAGGPVRWAPRRCRGSTSSAGCTPCSRS